MKLSSLIALSLAAAIFIPDVALAGRTIRNDNPGFLCDAQEWGTLSEDPYRLLDGNSNGKRNAATFFIPGTVTTGDTVAICVPQVALSKIWKTDDPGQAPNPASKPDSSGEPTMPALTAKGAVMYEWANNGPSPPLNFLLAPDAEVIVWTIGASKIFPAGVFELELDNWCGPSPDPDFTSGQSVPPNATSSLSWHGNLYTADCGGGNNNNATDLLLNSWGVLIGYVDANNDRQISKTAPGWQESLFTTTSLAVSPNPAKAGSNVVFQGVVLRLPDSSIPTGTVSFYNNGTTLLGSGSANSVGIASFNTSQLAAGSYTITAAYGGDADHAASTSTARTLTVN